MKIKLCHFIIVLTLFVGIQQAAAQGTTAFTYQGQLHDNGTNANGTYTMIFALYDSVSSGSQIGSAITNSPTIANGLFTVNLDFGANAFNGSARWLDITISNGVVQTLSPRVQVMPAAYAQFAAVAATVKNGAITAAQIQDGAVLAVNIASEQVAKSLNGLNDDVILSAGANTALFTNGNSLQMSAVISNIQVFTNNGFFVVPTNVTRIEVEMWGGGGGGGKYIGSPYFNTGGGGGAGAYAWNVFNVTPESEYTVTVGYGGVGGEAGGTSRFGTLISAGGGLQEPMGRKAVLVLAEPEELQPTTCLTTHLRAFLMEMVSRVGQFGAVVVAIFKTVLVVVVKVTLVVVKMSLLTEPLGKLSFITDQTLP